jgi:hypothetical protein
MSASKSFAMNRQSLCRKRNGVEFNTLTHGARRQRLPPFRGLPLSQREWQRPRMQFIPIVVG